MKISLAHAQEQASKMEGNENDLYEFLNSLLYGEGNPSKYTLIFEKYIYDKRSDIIKKCIEAILSVLHKRESVFTQLAIKYLKMPTTHENFDLRLACATGLGNAYYRTKDYACMQALHSVMIDESDDKVVRSYCLEALLSIYFGYTSQEIVERQGTLTPPFNTSRTIFEEEALRLSEIMKDIG